MLGIKLLTVATDFHMKHSMEVNVYQEPTFIKISSFVFNRRKKLIQVYKNLKMSKLWQFSFFGVNYPLLFFSCIAKIIFNLLE